MRVIGTLNEGALHAQLKEWYRRPGDRLEQSVGGFVVDLVRGDLLVEIEAPYRELFRRDGQQREELTHAINQIHDWLQYIQDNKTAVEEKLGLLLAGLGLRLGHGHGRCLPSRNVSFRPKTSVR